ncbi:hypothetical protein [Roseivirga misakiensis]|uniref:Lipocalin-like domain-containing protein n=1 Tax=Roseivirga misakiensis TaxID=1563681 RepID=A0A1E5T4Q6_9BACT|nr:hypothetical protein [Roseivirga misakiensis]OEK06358.1 hypothetical protein BFP71_01385 [Roseivirga misakiensis]
MKVLFISLSLALSLLFGSTTIDSAVAYDPSGNWELEVELPSGKEEGAITITKDEDGDYEVTLVDTDEDENIELDEVSFDEEEMVMTGEFETEGMAATIEMTFDDDSVEGTISFAGFEITFSGEREK